MSDNPNHIKSIKTGQLHICLVTLVHSVQLNTVTKHQIQQNLSQITVSDSGILQYYFGQCPLS